MQLKKCALGVAWTSALTAVAITFVLFTFFDPGTAVELLSLQVDPGEFRMKAYLFMSLMIWLILAASVAMNCFYRTLRSSRCGCAQGEASTEE